MDEKKKLLFNLVLSSLIELAFSRIEGMTDEEIDQAIADEEIRKSSVMDRINSH